MIIEIQELNASFNTNVKNFKQTTTYFDLGIPFFVPANIAIGMLCKISFNSWIERWTAIFFWLAKLIEESSEANNCKQGNPLQSPSPLSAVLQNKLFGRGLWECWSGEVTRQYNPQNSVTIISIAVWFGARNLTFLGLVSFHAWKSQKR